MIWSVADRLGGGQVDAGLGLVGQPDHGRPGAGLGDGAQCRSASGEVGERPSLVPGGLRRRMHAHPHPGDDAEHALGTDDQLTQIRAGRRLRGAAEVQHAGRGDHAQAADHVVEPAVARRVLAGRPGRGVAAEAGEFEALRKMSERKTVLRQAVLRPAAR